MLRVERMKVNCILVVVSGVYYGAVSTAASLRLSLNAAFNFTRATGCTLRIELLRPAACGRSVRWRRRRQKKDRTEWQVPFTRQKSDPRGARRTAERQVLTLKPTPRRRPPPTRLLHGARRLRVPRARAPRAVDVVRRRPRDGTADQVALAPTDHARRSIR